MGPLEGLDSFVASLTNPQVDRAAGRAWGHRCHRAAGRGGAAHGLPAERKPGRRKPPCTGPRAVAEGACSLERLSAQVGPGGGVH